MFIYLALLVLISAFSASAYQYFVLKIFPKPLWIERLHNAAQYAFAYLVIMIYNPAAFLTIATCMMVIIKLYDHFQPKEREISVITETSRSIWLFLLIFWFIRTFIYDYSPIPSGSMEPTLLAGDIIAINKTQYQIKIPPFTNAFYQFSKPKRGDVIVFNAPNNPQQFWIKRVIGIPGDEVEYRNKEYYLNGEVCQQTGHSLNYHGNQSNSWMVYAEESIVGYKHSIQLDNRKFNKSIKITVPEGTVFVSGDNRDYSYDSRVIGPIPENCIVGKATHILTQLNWHTFLSFKRSGRID